MDGWMEFNQSALRSKQQFFRAQVYYYPENWYISPLKLALKEVVQGSQSTLQVSGHPKTTSVSVYL